MSELICEACGNVWPLDKFPSIGTAHICEYCILDEDIDKVKRKITAKTGELINKMDEASGPGKNLGRIKDVVEMVYKEFGGPAGFARKFAWVIDELCTRKQVPASAGSLMLSMMKIHLSVEAKEETHDLRVMTDEQIRRAQEIELAKMIMDASADPSKRSALGRMLNKSGFKLEQMSPKEALDSISREVDRMEDGDAESDSPA